MDIDRPRYIKDNKKLSFVSVVVPMYNEELYIKNCLLSLVNQNYVKDEYERIERADALVIITEWNQFRRLDFTRIKKIMKDNYIFDLRNMYSKEIIEKENGFRYFSVGR